ncbi:MAG: ABC transporter ATP-binding protein, partial [Oscillospiraceae bacterium]|nr:ABC transporter ATP-binding protein [Oscillospiraceae bacterium]
MAETPKNGPKGGPGAGPRGGIQKPKNMKKTAVRMFSYLTRRPLLLALALLCVVISSLASVASTYLMRPIINNIAAAAAGGTGVIEGLLGSVAALLGVYFFAAACSYFQSVTLANLAQRGSNIMLRELFDKMQELPLTYFDRHPHGELMSRFTNDADNVRMALEQSMAQIISSVVTFVGTVAMMIYLSPPLFLVTCLTLAVVMFAFKFLGGRSRTYFSKQQAALGEMNGNIQEMIEGLKVV